MSLHCLLMRDIEGRKKTAESTKNYRNPVFSRVDILLMVAKKPIIHIILLSNLIVRGSQIPFMVNFHQPFHFIMFACYISV